MSVKIRIRNVQSIRDATLVVDGFTVVTGPNNSGKTASQRAVRGVFTNASSGSLLRHGEDQLTVDLEFSDGNSVRWEKGDKVNRYTVNGKTLSAVGRGVPPEVAALGVMPIKASSDNLWPQIAEQFGGVLFLVDRPGSVVAEALSDVDKVGKLTDALRFSESDRRSVSSELKVRLNDLTSSEEEVQSFQNLSLAEKEVERLEQLLRSSQDLSDEVDLLSDLRDRALSCGEDVRFFFGAPSLPISSDGIDLARDHARNLEEASSYLDQISRERRTLSSFEGFEVELPSLQEVTSLGDSLHSSLRLFSSLSSARDFYQLALSASDTAGGIQIPPAENLLKVSGLLRELKDLDRRLSDSRRAVEKEQQNLAGESSSYEGHLLEVQELLGEVGECPTCKSLCEGAHFS